MMVSSCARKSIISTDAGASPGSLEGTGRCASGERTGGGGSGDEGVIGTPPADTLTVGTGAGVEVGVGLVTVNVSAFDDPPPGDGLVTVTVRAPALTISPPVTVAVSWVEDAKEVAREAPSKRTVEFATKFEPFIIKVKSMPPAVIEVGFNEEMTGTGFGAALMVKIEAPEVPPPGPGLTTAMELVPTLATFEDATVAVSAVAEP